MRIVGGTAGRGGWGAGDHTNVPADQGVHVLGEMEQAVILDPVAWFAWVWGL